jgi:hypothetical protein
MVLFTEANLAQKNIVKKKSRSKSFKLLR